MNTDGVMQFNSDALKEFQRRGIHFVAFCDGLSGKTAVRPLVRLERKALGISRPAPFADIGPDEESPRDYLRFVGIKIRAGKNYDAYLIGRKRGILVRVL